jgi:hypothetical protein
MTRSASFIDALREAEREEGRAETVGSLLRYRFGDDDRIPGIARRLVPASTDEVVALIEKATSLADLDGSTDQT